MTTGLILSTQNTADVSSTATVNELANSWINFSRKSEKTRRAYDCAIKQWLKFISQNQITNPARRDVENFVDGLKAEGKSVSTINLYTVAVRLFYRWTAQQGLYPNVADGVKAECRKNHKHKKNALTATEGGHLIQSAKGDKLIDKRNAAIIALCITCGLRVSEISTANVEDIEKVDGRHYLSVLGKGHVERDERVLVAEQVYQLIQDYLQARGNVSAIEPLFTATRRNKGGRLSSQSISKMIKRHLKAIGLQGKRYSAHSLRHSAACQMITAGVELRQVQSVLRHVSINTTLVYLDEVNRRQNLAEQIIANDFFANV